jgi:hypothetical protein
MTFIGPAPYLVGLSCKEARRVMERSYIQFDSLRGGPSTFHWVNVEKTLVFFGNGIDIAKTFSPEERAKFKYVALDWFTLSIQSFPLFPNLEGLAVGPIGMLRTTRPLSLSKNPSARDIQSLTT